MQPIKLQIFFHFNHNKEYQNTFEQCIPIESPYSIKLYIKVGKSNRIFLGNLAKDLNSQKPCGHQIYIPKVIWIP